MEPNVPAEIKVKEYTRLYNQFLDLQQQLPNYVAYRPRQETTPRPSTTQSPPRSSYTTPENILSAIWRSDSGIASKTTTPSLLERFTSKIKTTLFRESLPK